MIASGAAWHTVRRGEATCNRGSSCMGVAILAAVRTSGTALIGAFGSGVSLGGKHGGSIDCRGACVGASYGGFCQRQTLQGLRQLERAHNASLSPKLRRQLIALDYSNALVRHVTSVSVADFIADLARQVARPHGRRRHWVERYRGAHEQQRRERGPGHVLRPMGGGSSGSCGEAGGQHGERLQRGGAGDEQRARATTSSTPSWSH